MIIITPGNVADCTVGPECVSLMDGIKKLLGDKAYDSNSFRKLLREGGIKPVIPGRANRTKRIRHDKEALQGTCRDVIESVAAGPLVRSSYHAEQTLKDAKRGANVA